MNGTLDCRNSEIRSGDAQFWHLADLKKKVEEREGGSRPGKKNNTMGSRETNHMGSPWKKIYIGLAGLHMIAAHSRRTGGGNKNHPFIGKTVLGREIHTGWKH